MSTKSIRSINLEGGRRTTMRLEPEFWAALDEIALLERTTVSNLIYKAAGPNNRTSASRVYALTCFRERAPAP